MSEFVGSYKDLLALLDAEGIAHQANEAEMSVVIPTEKGDLDSALLMRWQESDGVLQLIQEIPMKVATSDLAPLMEALTRLNHDLAVPGVGLAVDDPTLYFRTYVPVGPGPVPNTVIRALFSTTVDTAAHLVPVLKKVIDGSLKPDAVVKAMNDEMAAGQ